MESTSPVPVRRVLDRTVAQILVARATTLTLGTRFIACEILLRSDMVGAARAATATVAEAIGCNQRTVQIALKLLQAGGWLTFRKGGDVQWNDAPEGPLSTAWAPPKMQLVDDTYRTEDESARIDGPDYSLEVAALVAARAAWVRSRGGVADRRGFDPEHEREIGEWLLALCVHRDVAREEAARIAIAKWMGMAGHGGFLTATGHQLRYFHKDLDTLSAQLMRTRPSSRVEEQIDAARPDAEEAARLADAALGTLRRAAGGAR